MGISNLFFYYTVDTDLLESSMDVNKCLTKIFNSDRIRIISCFGLRKPIITMKYKELINLERL